MPAWAHDAAWLIDSIAPPPPNTTSTIPFAQVWHAVVAAADAHVPASERCSSSARQDLRDLLSGELSALSAPTLYDRFRAEHDYQGFVARETTGGLEEVFDEKPVLLRLAATLVRQWIDATTEFVQRLDADDLEPKLAVPRGAKVIGIHGGLSDRHSGGRGVLAVEFDDGSRIMYKPKDIEVDTRCHELIGELNEDAPLELRVPRVVSREGYGWTEFIDHTCCRDERDVATYFERAGAWLALFHALAAGDMHQENLIACGAHPVPIDLETVLQQPERVMGTDHPSHRAARKAVNESVLAVGLLPGYARTGQDDAFVVGGMASNWTTRETVAWHDVNTDEMRPIRVTETPPTTNLPHVDGRHYGLDGQLDALLRGFRGYATFLAGRAEMLSRFKGTRVRRVVRPTQFYDLLLTRLRDDRSMGDGATWSAQADFVARMADWEDDADPLWPLVSEERAALLQLDVPMFTTDANAGIDRATRRIRGLDADHIEWECDVITQAASLQRTDDDEAPPRTHELGSAAEPSEVTAAADAAIEAISTQAVRRDDGAAWVGLNWIGDSNVGQFAVLGHDLYSGTCGIAVALAAHARVRGSAGSADLARAALAHLRAQLTGSNAGHVARLLGLGGASGLGSVCYGLSVTGALLDDDAMLADARRCAALITDEMIASDKQFDVVGGVAGAALGLLRLHRDVPDGDVLQRSVRCGEHLLTAPPPELTGMSHGAAGYGHALATLAAATGRDDFADAAQSMLDTAIPDDGHWRSLWCHGAVGIGLATLGEAWLGDAVDRVWPGHVDTLCCGSLGAVEFAREAGEYELAARRLAAVLRNPDGYRWNAGATRFNLGLFRGLAGVAYTCLRELDVSLPNVLLWQ